MDAEGGMDGGMEMTDDVILRLSWRVTEVEVITASHHPHSSVTDQSSLSATSSSTATKVLHESLHTHKKIKKLTTKHEILQVLIHKRIKCNRFLQIAPLLPSVLWNIMLWALTLLEGKWKCGSLNITKSALNELNSLNVHLWSFDQLSH